MIINRVPLLALALAASTQAACLGGTATPGDGDDTTDVPVMEDAGPPEVDEIEEALAERVVDYNAALRTAALRLVGDLPTMEEINAVALASEAEKPSVYQGLVAAYLDDPRFTRQILRWWQDTFKTGGTAQLDSAANFAAQVTVEDRPYTDLLTATAGTCPTYDAETNTFTAADCANGAPVTAGLLSHPGVMSHFFGNMAFRRVRWVQETFDCAAFPVELGEPQDVGGNTQYLGLWPFDSIAGFDNGGTIDFMDAESVVCANCHQTMNHMAPLFGNFDEAGMYQAAISVPTPAGETTLLSDWLPQGETPAWRYQVPTADLGALGAAMAADPRISECAVARAWNWALGKGDIVDSLTSVPPETIADQVIAFEENGYKFKALLLDVFTSSDFVRF